jgi:hypothetical protein
MIVLPHFPFENVLARFRGRPSKLGIGKRRTSDHRGGWLAPGSRFAALFFIVAAGGCQRDTGATSASAPRPSTQTQGQFIDDFKETSAQLSDQMGRCRVPGLDGDASGSQDLHDAAIKSSELCSDAATEIERIKFKDVLDPYIATELNAAKRDCVASLVYFSREYGVPASEGPRASEVSEGMLTAISLEKSCFSKVQAIARKAGLVYFDGEWTALAPGSATSAAPPPTETSPAPADTDFATTDNSTAPTPMPVNPPQTYASPQTPATVSEPASTGSPPLNRNEMDWRKMAWCVINRTPILVQQGQGREAIKSQIHADCVNDSVTDGYMTEAGAQAATDKMVDRRLGELRFAGP